MHRQNFGSDVFLRVESSAIAAASQRYTELSALLDEKELRWLELSEKDV